MRHLLDIMSGVLGQSVQHKLKTLAVWEAPLTIVQAELLSGLSLCEQWCKICADLTSAWKIHDEDRPWGGSIYDSEHTLNLGRRFMKILALRETHDEFNFMLNCGIGKEGQIDLVDNQVRAAAGQSLAEHFSDINPLLYSSHTDPTWFQISLDEGSSIVLCVLVRLHYP
mmetsp:Transcript_28192/g.87223  ORF Transcript_28192/g.87223 Transcript_28192/m.87223 type:complete len:169 (-) Transcript_28192:6582-7088(-)